MDEAVAFLKFVASPAEMKTYINDFGYIASRKDVAATQFTSDPLNDPIMKVFAAQMAVRPAARSASALARDLRRPVPRDQREDHRHRYARGGRREGAEDHRRHRQVARA